MFIILALMCMGTCDRSNDHLDPCSHITSQSRDVISCYLLVIKVVQSVELSKAWLQYLRSARWRWRLEHCGIWSSFLTVTPVVGRDTSKGKPIADCWKVR